MLNFVQGLWAIALFYPLAITCVWITGAVYYYWRRERVQSIGEINRQQSPRISVIVPCHNAESTLATTFGALTALDYPDFEIIAVNDGSRDATASSLNQMAMNEPRLRVVHLATNQGKPMALRAAAMVSTGEFLLCIDDDTQIDSDALWWAVHHFKSSARVGAVSGNPRVSHRQSLLGRFQVGEFSAMRGIVKRASRVYGRVFSLSGSVCAFRRSALQRVGYWDLDCVAEDTDIGWKLQLDHWDVRFEPRMTAHVRQPETLRGLFNQRLRTAQGGIEVLRKYTSQLCHWRSRRMWPVLIEHVLNVVWALAFGVTLVTVALAGLFPQAHSFGVNELLPGWTGVWVGIACFVMYGVGVALDGRYEDTNRHGLMSRYHYGLVWYPLAFWVMKAVALWIALPRALLRKRGDRAVWVSPDRGFQS